MDKKKRLEEKYKKLKSNFQTHYILRVTLINNNNSAIERGHDNIVLSFIQLNDDRLASSKMWNILTCDYETTFTRHNDIVLWLAELNNERLASGSYDNGIKLWDLTLNKCKHHWMSYFIIRW